MPRATLAALALLALAVPAARPAAAQGMTRPAPPPFDASARRQHIIGVSPIHLLFGSAAGDYEQALGRDVSLGAGVTFSDRNSILTSATSGGYDLDVSAKARYYLNGTAPEGSSVGVVAGFVHGERDRRSDAAAGTPATRRQTAPTLGFTLDYNRLVGRSRRLVLGTGYGLKRRFITTRDAEAYERFAEVQYTIRILAGYAW